ncbi:hypothetical protein [Hydrogenovibrio sp. SC-1]|uniref:hypothetical protein n=1 Tax=Hydrogenovibrio sp. SC-1 TaxID=2065820 RepID=UPI0018EAE432|nr:hypothetical protein [Hydrogenovibrio sp. SC-1]
MNKPFQRVGSSSNAQAGRDFEISAKNFFQSQGMNLDLNVKVPVGISALKKDHAFDLGCLEKKIVVECKSHKWTSGDNVPSAKLTVWNEAMYYFLLFPLAIEKLCLCFVISVQNEMKHWFNIISEHINI